MPNRPVLGFALRREVRASSRKIGSRSCSALFRCTSAKIYAELFEKVFPGYGRNFTRIDDDRPVSKGQLVSVG